MLQQTCVNHIPALLSICSAEAALEKSAEYVDKFLSEVNHTLTLQILISFGQNVVFVTMSDDKEVSAFNQAAGQ